MLKTAYRASSVVLLGGVIVALCTQIPVPAASQAPSAATTRVVTAANAFLSLLDATQTPKAKYAYTDPIKSKWHNLPPGMAGRAGIRLKELTPPQREAAEAVVRAVLSGYGERKVQSIMAADKYLGEKMGSNVGTGPDGYMLAIFGSPSATEPWEVQFNGHHLGVNVTIVGAAHVLAPTLTAAYPNIYTDGDRKVVVLADEADRALMLLNSLDAAQRARTIQTAQIWDFLLGPGKDGQVLQPEGLKASDMTAAQKALLLDLTAAWVNIIDDQAAAAKMAEVRKNLDNTYFLWSGDTTVSGRAYFRVQGPTVWIEYSPQTVGGPGSIGGGGGRRGDGARGGDGAGGGDAARGGRGNFGAVLNDPNRQLDPTHVHTVYRDFTNDYGKAFASPF
ncbi:MAG: DUF3500 domain-containing protein [Vicinamibacterales bacterium]